MRVVPPIREADFQAQILDAARIFGWTSAHFRPALTSRGWRTAVSGDGAGFPDLVLVRAPRVIFAELKSERGRLSPDQTTWLDLLGACTGAETYVWRPSDLDAAIEILNRRAHT